MVLVAHQQQGLYVTFSSRHLPCNKRLKLKQCLTKRYLIGRADWHYMLKQTTCLRWIYCCAPVVGIKYGFFYTEKLTRKCRWSFISASCKGLLVSSVGPPHICGSKPKPLRITGFKGSDQNGHSVTRANELKVRETSVRLEENGVVKSESPKAHSVPFSCASDANENHAASSGIHKLFRKWLTILRTPPSNQGVEEISGEPPPRVLPESAQGVERTEKGQTLKVLWSNCQALDTTIKIPLLIFAPLYVAVNAIYGAEVSKELTPLWVMGPFIVALYIMIVRGLCALYVFSFKQTVNVMKSLPSYCILAYSYIFYGKLKEDIKTHILQPILSIKNADYKQLTRKKLKELAEWIGERYLDFVESIWPHYCRTIRFLKRANLI